MTALRREVYIYNNLRTYTSNLRIMLLLYERPMADKQVFYYYLFK